ncbi:protein CHROMATIN REMODELING 24 [Cucumis melo var. makuwa]|uniref:Protein CHROMATIN REMODELING 24 n=1 Tax=Cucumis melo var. makuwa TaxID=1194695 RepID=A0A5D3BG74_CUCMM|nr:protein CHROMATIN REMODELING 24 [Cucumis melo var. makuwa]TYJ98762.1 protein CHROMATIN REMODELING 24 [Cucumis melo var. makuwa]
MKRIFYVKQVKLKDGKALDADIVAVGVKGRPLISFFKGYYGTSAKLRQYELNYILLDKGVLLTSYDIVRNNSKSLQGNCFSEDDETEDGTTWDYMILDEVIISYL